MFAHNEAWIKKEATMIREYHNHILHTNPRQREKEPQDIYTRGVSPKPLIMNWFIYFANIILAISLIIQLCTVSTNYITSAVSLDKSKQNNGVFDMNLLTILVCNQMK